MNSYPTERKIMITQETAARIWKCHREIIASKKTLEDLSQVIKDDPHEEYKQKLKDGFGCFADIELGIPSGDNSHRVYGISKELAQSVLRAHISNMEAKLSEANEQARIELDG